MVMYCVQCEEMVDMPYGLDDIHWLDADNQWGMDLCEGFFTTSAPPELEEDWQDNLVEPDADEWTKINLNAHELLMDLVGLGV